MITKVVNVDLHLPIYERLTAKQGDIASRFILFHLLDGDTPFDLTGKNVRVYARKPDKTEIFNDLIINDETKGYCTLELTSQCLAEAGIVKMELYISQSGKVLTSIPFELEVIGCINTTNSVVSTNEFSALEAALGSLQDYDNFKREIIGARKTYGTVGQRLDTMDNDIEIATPISTLSSQGITDEKNGQNISSVITNILSNNNEKKYYYFDKKLEVNIDNTLINYENSFLFGNAKINRFNPNNIFVNIADTFIKQYNGSINSCKNINQLKVKLGEYINENRAFNVCVWGDSLSTGGDMLGINSSNPVCQRSFSPDGISRNESYYSYLVDKLSEKINTKTINFYNRAIGGTKITAWESEVEFNSLTKKWIEHVNDTAPDLLIIGFGMNHINFDSSLKFSACAKKIIDYINANFAKKPVIAFVTSPRPVYIPGLLTYGTYEGQASVQNTANVVRNFINNENYYVIDVNKISNIKRAGCDYLNPYFYKYTDEGVVEKTKNLTLGDKYTINRYVKDFSLKFKAKVSNASLNDKLVIRFNKVKSDNFNENQVGITFRNSADKTEIKSSCRIADYDNWGSTGTVTKTAQLEKMDETVFRIEKKGKFLSVWYGLDGENLILRDICDVLDINGYIQLTLSGSTISAILSDITLYDAEYTTYTQSLTEKQMYGEYNGTIETKMPYGGNSVNHPTSKGISECYIPSINEFIDEIF